MFIKISHKLQITNYTSFGNQSLFYGIIKLDIQNIY